MVNRKVIEEGEKIFWKQLRRRKGLGFPFRKKWGGHIPGDCGWVDNELPMEGTEKDFTPGTPKKEKERRTLPQERGKGGKR